MIKQTKGTRESPLFAEVYGTLRARVGRRIKFNKCEATPGALCVCVCVCVCVSKISEAAKYKPLKSAEESTLLRSTLLNMFIFVFVITFTLTRQAA